jgi:hypothetical protein
VKPGILLLIIGGALLAAGLVIAGISTYSVTKQVLERSTIIDNTSLEPTLSFAAVMKDLPAGQQLILSLSSNPPDVPIQARITEPDGNTLAIYNITKTPFTSTTETKIDGDHTLEIKNVGSSTVTINGAVLNSPVAQQGGGVSVQDNPSVQTLVTYGIGILVGIVLIIAGIVLLIIGAVKYARGRKSASQPSSAPQ